MSANGMALAQAKARDRENKEREAAALERATTAPQPPAPQPAPKAAAPVPAPVARTEAAMESPVQRTSQGLRDALFDEIDQLRSGKGNANRAMAIAKLSAQIMSTVSVELKARQVARDLRSDDEVKAIRLGS